VADQNTSLPVRTETNGDVVAQIVDGTVASQKLAVDAAGKIVAKLDDASGNGLTSQVNGTQQALDVGVNVAGVQVDPRSIRALTSADVVTANQGSANVAANGWPVKPTDGTNSQSFTAAGEAKVDVTQPLPAGTNNIGKVSVQDSSGSAISMANPLPVTMSSVVPGSTDVVDYKTATPAAAASDTHTYTVPALKTLYLQKIAASSSGKIKVEIKYGVIASEVTKVVLFNSTANPNVEYAFGAPQALAAGGDVLVIVTNLDKQTESVYSTIEGYEI
jgi:hypothetical protein